VRRVGAPGRQHEIRFPLAHLWPRVALNPIDVIRIRAPSSEVIRCREVPALIELHTKLTSPYGISPKPDAPAPVVNVDTGRERVNFIIGPIVRKESIIVGDEVFCDDDIGGKATPDDRVGPDPIEVEAAAIDLPLHEVVDSIADNRDVAE